MRTQNKEQRTKNTEHRAQSTEQRAQNTEHRAQNKEQRTQNTEHRAQNTEQRTKNTEQRAQNKEKNSLGSWLLALGSWLLVLGSRFLALGSWFLTLGSWLLVLGSWLLALPSDAYAMHISEGILPFNWAALWFAVAIPFVALGLYQLKKKSSIDVSFKPLVGLMAAIVFVISCMPVPVPTAGTCSHPCGTAISGILVGPFISILITAVALLIQALFLAHGGLSTWGADIVSMGVMGSFVGYLTFKGLRALKANLWIAGFFAGLLADWATYFTTSVELASGIRGDSPFIPLFTKILIAFIPTQLPLGILEGAMTAGMVMLLYKKRPELLIKLGVVKRNITILLLILLPLLFTTHVFAEESKWGGVDESVVEKYAEEHGRAAREALINTDQGDLLLFVFLLAGVVGGFVAGYCWRMLSVEQRTKSKE